jgi:hypothetical protein
MAKMDATGKKDEHEIELDELEDFVCENFDELLDDDDLSAPAWVAFSRGGEKYGDDEDLMVPLFHVFTALAEKAMEKKQYKNTQAERGDKNVRTSNNL